MQSLFDDLWTKAGLFYTSTGCALAGPPATCDGTGTKYDDMYNAAPAAAPQHATFLGYVDTIITSSPGTPHLGDLQASSASVGVAPADPDVFKTAADTMITKLDALTTGAPAPLTAVSTYSSTVQGYISGLPDMTPLKTILSAIAGKYQPTVRAHPAGCHGACALTGCCILGATQYSWRNIGNACSFGMQR